MALAGVELQTLIYEPDAVTTSRRSNQLSYAAKSICTIGKGTSRLQA